MRIKYHKDNKISFTSSSGIYYNPDELFCKVIKTEGNQITLVNPFTQSYEELRRFLYLLKNGLPLLDKVNYEISLVTKEIPDKYKPLLNYFKV